MSALSEQFQRLSIAAPIRTLTELNPRKMPSDQQQNPGFCWNAWYMQHDGLLLACKSPSVSSPKNLVMVGICNTCKAEIGFISENPKFSRVHGRANSFLLCCHSSGKPPEEMRYHCPVCWKYRQFLTKSMNRRNWEVHVGRHFDEDGYQVCIENGIQKRFSTNCRQSGCKKVYSRGCTLEAIWKPPRVLLIIFQIS